MSIFQFTQQSARNKRASVGLTDYHRRGGERQREREKGKKNERRREYVLQYEWWWLKPRQMRRHSALLSLLIFDLFIYFTDFLKLYECNL